MAEWWQEVFAWDGTSALPGGLQKAGSCKVHVTASRVKGAPQVVLVKQGSPVGHQKWCVFVGYQVPLQLADLLTGGRRGHGADRMQLTAPGHRGSNPISVQSSYRTS